MKRFIVTMTGLIIALLLLVIWNVTSGSVSVDGMQMWQVLLRQTREGTFYHIVWDIRMPRLLAALFLGGALAVSGFLLQTFFQNPIAGPYVLGISSGAKMLVAVAMILCLERGMQISSLGMVAAAFIGSLLAMGFVLLFVSLARIGRGKSAEGARLVLSSGRRPAPVDLTGHWLRAAGRRVWRVLPVAVMALSFAALTLFGALRWVVSGTVPMANGFETMLFVAWVVMLLSLVCAARLRVVLTFGFIMSGFFLLVSHISQMDPQISHVMPVLNSPLLSVHVSIIMFAFAMLSITFICAVTALLSALRLRLVRARGGRAADGGGRAESDGRRVLESYAVLSRLFLYPAVSALTIGIFIGAVWAERSWGQYWAWDPKETWALITLLIYVVPLHTATVASLRRPMAFHVFMALAFLSIVMTYFGVNYFLGGMHSYA